MAQPLHSFRVDALINGQEVRLKLTRRAFVKTTTAGVLLAGVPARWRGTAYASDAPETAKVAERLAAGERVVAHALAAADGGLIRRT